MTFVGVVIDLPVVLTASYAYAHAPWTLVLFVGPYLTVSHLVRRRLELTRSLRSSVDRLATANLQFAAAMVHALDARDSYTAGHSAAVAVYSRDIARELGMTSEDVHLAHLAGLLHDVGKIGVPGHVLNKRGALDEDEQILMQDHAAIGAAILGEVDEYNNIATVVRHHHERFDGMGYPDQLGGELIPVLSRIIAVADTYSAMTTDRSYRKGLDPMIAISELTNGGGKQWDRPIVEAFVRILETASEDYRRGWLTDFDVEVAKHGAFEDGDGQTLPPENRQTTLPPIERPEAA